MSDKELQLALEFESDADGIGPGDISLRSVKGREAMSEPYEYELVFETPIDGGFASEDIDALLVRACRLRYGRDMTSEVHGILRAVELLPTIDSERVQYRAWLVPRFWGTTLHRNSQVFQDQSADAIVTAVLGEDGLSGALRPAFSSGYPARTFVAQYRETDFNFVSRMMEHWGIFYFFDQGPDGEVMVLADSNGAATPLDGFETIAFAAQEGDGFTDEGTIRDVRRMTSVQPSSIAVHDYNYRTPGVPVSGSSACDAATGRGGQIYYADHAKDGGEASRFAGLRAEQMMSLREVYRMRCSVDGIAPGHRFVLDGHPLPELCREYLVIETEFHRGLGASQVHTELTAIPYEVPYRAPRRAKVPHILGFMHGTVDGSPGTAAPIDDQGRYLVKIPYDMAGGAASRWVRMAQSSAGSGYGMHLPLHAGTEVAIVHLDGDPDRPIIMGAIPNPATFSPVTAANATQSQLRTQAGIMMVLEDDA